MGVVGFVNIPRSFVQRGVELLVDVERLQPRWRRSLVVQGDSAESRILDVGSVERALVRDDHQHEGSLPVALYRVLELKEPALGIFDLLRFPPSFDQVIAVDQDVIVFLVGKQIVTTKGYFQRLGDVGIEESSGNPLLQKVESEVVVERATFKSPRH